MGELRKPASTVTAMHQPSATGTTDTGETGTAFSQGAFSPGVRLPHLAGPGAEVRQVMAAHFLRGCREVIEIGGAGLPITAFLTHRPQAVTVIDPKIAPFTAETLNGAPCRVRHLAAKLQAVPLAPEPGGYGLVLLGLSLKPFGAKPAIGEKLLGLAGGAAVIVIDYALGLERAVAQIPAFLALEGLTVRVDLNLRLANAALAGTGFAERRFLVLEPAGKERSADA
jgi:hypothetical protein